MFGRHGIPETIVIDNGPQYSSVEFQQFSKDYVFLPIINSPPFPQSSGQAEGCEDQTKIAQECWRSLSVTAVIQSHPTTMVHPVSSRTIDGKSNSQQCTSTIPVVHSKMILFGKGKPRWLLFQDQTEVSLRQTSLNQTALQTYPTTQKYWFALVIAWHWDT